MSFGKLMRKIRLFDNFERVVGCHPELVEGRRAVACPLAKHGAKAFARMLRVASA